MYIQERNNLLQCPMCQKQKLIQCLTQEGQGENKQWQCPVQADTVLDDRKCQKVKSVHMQPQKPTNCELWLRKPAIKCNQEHREDQIVMLSHKPATKVKKPGQAPHKEIVDNKNCSNVNIVNVWPQKPSLRDEQFKSQPQCIRISTRHIKENLFVMTRSVKHQRKLCVRARTVHLPSLVLYGQWSQQWKMKICS